MRVASIDPGTKSFDVTVIEDGKPVWGESVEARAVAERAEILLEVLERARAEYIAAPSGYGVPLTRGSEVRDPETFSIEVLLLSTREQIAEGIRGGEPGMHVYAGLASVAKKLIESRGSSVVFLPAVIHLPTVPAHRKMNKVDMGTVDKLASAFIAVHAFAERESVSYDKVNLVVAELGYGYVGAIAVSGGRVVDGIGGSYASIGPLTPGAMDMEVVGGAGSWSRWDIWRGSIYEISAARDMEELARRAEMGEKEAEGLLLAYIEGVAKDVARARLSAREAEIVIATGRFARSGAITRRIAELLDIELIPAHRIIGWELKEASLGYAAMAEGALGGAFAELSSHMKIAEACGTATDYIVHPRAKAFKERVREAYVRSVSRPRLCSG